MGSEIISTVERQRKWALEDKLRIIEEALTSGTIAAIADRNGVCRSLLYTWLRQARSGSMPGISIASGAAASFVPVQIAPLVPVPSPSRSETVPDPPASPCRPQCGCRPAQVEVTLTNGRLVKVDECIDPEVLALLVAALDGSAR
jgi:transposase